MSTPATLPISDIVNIVVNISPQAPLQPTFNMGLIVGSSAVIPSYTGTNPRIRQYSSLAQILADGFNTSSPEYLAAQIYFSQSPKPQFVFIGRQDLTAISACVVNPSAEGTGYVVGDVLTVLQGGASNGLVKVSAIGGSGQVTAVTLFVQGTGYTVATALATTGGTGTGAQINITALGESCLQAAEACRATNYQWYGLMVIGAAKQDHEDIAAWAQSITPVVMYFGQTSDGDALAGTAGNIFSALKALNYNRAFMLYSSTQGGNAPSNVYAGAAAMGSVMGQNTGLAGSYFTEKFKVLVGIVAEPLTEAQKATIEGNNGNLYLSYGNAYTFVEQGVVSNGQFLDELVQLDMLVSAMQYALMNVLTETPAIPQTDPGQALLLHAVNQACDTSVSIGFIAPGTWDGPSLPPPLKLANGQALPKGYLAQSAPYSTQPSADRQARKAMPIFVNLIEAGAAHFLTVQVNVQR